MHLCPLDARRRVEPGTSGDRLAGIGWMTSRVRDARRRVILTGMDEAVAAEEPVSGDRARLTRLAKVRSNLLRMSAE